MSYFKRNQPNKTEVQEKLDIINNLLSEEYERRSCEKRIFSQQVNS